MADSTSSGSRSGLIPGTLDMLILRTLLSEPLHGYAIARSIEESSQGVFHVEQGSLYPTLERLLGEGFVTARWAESSTGRHARYYTITPSGRKRLKTKAADFQRVVGAITRVLSGA
jgi:PadR family transcriptional regulator PadR